MTRGSPPGLTVTALDIGLLRGFRFACRPGCGLCCYANPAVTPSERPPLLQLSPAPAFLEGDEGYSFLASRDGGGACALLGDTRCRGHAVRPFPCRSFPISVHLGPRAQASVVLSCPGLDLGVLETYPETVALPDPAGMDAELASVRQELRRPASVTAAQSARESYREAVERQEARSAWLDPGEFRADLRRRHDWRELDAYPEPAPSDEQGLEALPLTFEPELGVAAIGGEGDRWTIRRMREGGGGVELGTYDLPEVPPRLNGAATRLLHGYLCYAFDRDAPFGQLLVERRGARLDWAEVLRAAVDAAAAMVVTRACVLAMARGESPESLGHDALLRGIRAADADLLDRPTVGAVL